MRNPSGHLGFNPSRHFGLVTLAAILLMNNSPNPNVFKREGFLPEAAILFLTLTLYLVSNPKFLPCF